MIPTQIDGFIFDLWNTLIKSGGPRLTQRLTHLLQNHSSPDSLDHEDVLDYLRATGSLHRETDFLEIAEGLWRQYMSSDPPVEFLRQVDAEKQAFVESAQYMKGAKETIDLLHSAGKRVAIVSNATSVSLEVADRMKIRELIPDFWISCVSGYLKPDPRAFTEVAKHWGISCKRICVIGDKISTDILGARLSGMTAIVFNPSLSESHRFREGSIHAAANSLGHVPHLIV